jgi:hypothetical protein
VVKKEADIRSAQVPNMRGGNGVIHFSHFLEADESFGTGGCLPR